VISLNDILSNPEGLFSSKQVAEALKISDSAIWNWINYNKIESTKVGNTWVFTGKNIKDYLDRQQVKSCGGFRSVAEVLASQKLPYERE
jgi:excisionase family DNA binding protein